MAKKESHPALPATLLPALLTNRNPVRLGLEAVRRGKPCHILTKLQVRICMNADLIAIGGEHRHQSSGGQRGPERLEPREAERESSSTLKQISAGDFHGRLTRRIVKSSVWVNPTISSRMLPPEVLKRWRSR